MADDGNYNIQVLQEALKSAGNFTLTNIDKSGTITNYNEEQGYIVHSVDHWFSIRKVHGIWFNLNSTNMDPGPQLISDFYLEAFLFQIKETGKTIFAV